MNLFGHPSSGERGLGAGTPQAIGAKSKFLYVVSRLRLLKE